MMVSMGSSSPALPRSSPRALCIQLLQTHCVAHLVGIMCLLQSHTLRDPTVNGKGMSKVNMDAPQREEARMLMFGFLPLPFV